MGATGATGSQGIQGIPGATGTFEPGDPIFSIENNVGSLIPIGYQDEIVLESDTLNIGLSSPQVIKI